MQDGDAAVASESVLLKCHGESTLSPENIKRCWENSCLKDSIPINVGVNDTEDIEDDRGRQYNVLENAIFEPCIALSSEHNSISSQSKVGAENGKVIVRSPYFLKKSTQEYNQFKKNYEDDAANKKCQTTISNFGYRSITDDCEKKTRTVNKNVIVRSSYFLHKPSKGSIHYDNIDNCSVKETVHNDKHMFSLEQVTSQLFFLYYFQA